MTRHCLRVNDARTEAHLESQKQGGGAILAPDLSSDNLYSSYSGSKYDQGRIKASAGPGAVPNEGPLQTYNQVITPTNCGPPKLWARNWLE